MNILFPSYYFVILLLAIFSYGFIDPNIHLTANTSLESIIKPLSILVYDYRPITTILFFVFICVLFAYYIYFFVKSKDLFHSFGSILKVAGITALILMFSYPALSYDLFNYMTTAKVSYFYKENPYIVMPIEIPNEPFLSFTRASNKVALYGPVWLLITALPHYVGGGSIWATIIAFKTFNAIAYLGFAYIMYRVTKSVKNVIFFAMNPLVLMEVLVSGHNDIYMMIFAVTAILLWEKNGAGNKIGGLVSFVASCLIKGASIVLFPIFFIKNVSRDRLLFISYWLLAFVFFVVAPLREELYPWYAVWLISIASLFDMKKHAALVIFTVVLSFALELRHLPYMWMGFYDGIGPWLRFLLTGIPLGAYCCYILYTHKLRNIL